jgi:hypothetical protein
MIKQMLILFIGLVFIFDCFADEPRFESKFESSNGEYSIQLHKNKWVLTNRKGFIKYSIKDNGFTSMTIFVSDNGQNIVIMDDYMEGRNVGERNALWIYKKGKLVKSYKLSDLLNDTCNISRSIGHLTWSYEDYGFIDKESQFSFSTYELSEFIFDLSTGQIVKIIKPDGYDSDCLIVFGDFRKGNENYATMKILKYISGKTQENNKITFKTESYGAGIWRLLLMIKDGVDITPEKYRGNLFLNSCLIE